MTRQWKFDEFYMEVAKQAALLSRCEKKKVGAVAVRQNNIVAFGFNGTPYNWETNVCELVDGKTADYVVHAEENVLCKAAKSGFSLEGSTLYITYAPCSRCARGLYQAGITKVVYLEPNDKGGSDMLRRLGVKVEVMEANFA